MNSQDLIYRRLYNQLITHRPFPNAGEVVHWMGAMQAQDYSSALLAVGIRTGIKAVNEATIEQAISNRKIVRTWPMRGTLHFVAAPDVRWMLRLLTPRVIRSSAGRYRQLELDDHDFIKSRRIIEGALQGKNQLTRQELFALLNIEGISTAGQRGIHILNHLAQKELICFGPRRGKQHTFTLLDEWIPWGEEVEHEEALATLADRYFTSHGPATVRDFANWAGLMVTDAKIGLEQVKENFEKSHLEGQTYWFKGEKGESGFNVKARDMWLLPAFDEMLCGYKDRSALLHSEHGKSIILKNGIISAVIVVKGYAAGIWKKVIKKGKVIFEPIYFHVQSKSLKKSFEKKAKVISDFLGKEAQIS